MPRIYRAPEAEYLEASSDWVLEYWFGGVKCRGIKTKGSQCVGLLITTSISFTPCVSDKEFDVKTSEPEAKESTSIASRDLFIPGS
jgi:hypothetical protein